MHTMNDIIKYAEICQDNTNFDPALYTKYNVKRGLRDLDGKGVLTGLTEISEIRQNKIVDGKTVPCDGKLFYRGYNVEDIIAGFPTDSNFGFEEVTYLLLFGNLPTADQLEDFKSILAEYRALPDTFVRDVIMKAPNSDMMNALAKSVLTLHSYDDLANDISIENVLRQSLQLIAEFPMIAVYAYHAYNFANRHSLFIHNPDPAKSTAENILLMLRPDKKYTELEAKVLDIALVLHAEHGGGNNSTFTTHVVTSSGTDTYSAIAAALCSLKGPKHGGANVKVCGMFDEMKASIKDWSDEDEVTAYLEKILHKEAFDKSGLIYGMGHAVYSISDPRARVFRKFVEQLAREKNMMHEYTLYENVEKLAPVVIGRERNIYKGVSANIDFYSGFVYSMLDLPMDLYTPLFAIARISGWSAHRIEELINAGKIIRPAYMSIAPERVYVPMNER
ncbi:MAG: citrate/2-methylcitrate synthase [Acutalibacteraceae bacterium]|nr:citrate/2-methylcitrate synthase [Clostridia bacterium]MEE3450538.1 citrate/2-methylcitrate synthase [Acutalibacteraceae bacterium]